MSLININDKSGIFTENFIFMPERSVTDEQTIEIFILFLRKLFVKTNPITKETVEFPNPTGNTAQERLTNLLITLQITFSPDVFEQLPNDIKTHFMVKDRNGNQYRYGRKPRALRG